jgi:hypothetical protein
MERAQRDSTEKTSKFRLGGSVAQNENCGCIISYYRYGLHSKRVKRNGYGGHLALGFLVELAFATAEMIHPKFK